MGDKGGLRSSHRKWSLALVVFFGLLFAREIAQGQQVTPSIAVTVNKSTVFSLAQKAKRVSVTQPEVASVSVVTPNQLLINGKSVGTTSLVVWDEKGVVTNYDLIVVPDVAALRMQLRALFPDEKIEISTSGPSLVLRGEVSNEVVYDKVLEIVQTYLPPKPKEEVAPAAPSTNVTITTGEARLPTTGTAFAGGGQLAFPEEASLTDVDRWGNKRAIAGIIDLLVIREVRQVQLEVVVAEVALDKLREIGLDFSVLTNRLNLRSNQGSQGGFPTPLLEDETPTGFTFGQATSAILSYTSNRFALLSLFRLFQNRDITEILAQPHLVIKNGRSGGFLAGGEFPVAIQQVGVGATSTTVVFKPFGVRLDFLPTITLSNSIDLRIFPEVSEVDFNVAVLGIPGLRVRRSVSRVEVKEGETLLMAGLLDRRILKDLTKFPILGDIPILGALFRSTRFRNQETELLFAVTPKIVKALRPGEKPKIPSIQKYDDSDIRQIPLPTYPAPEASAPGVPSGKPAPAGPTIP
ncbi:MAG: type II and III secretion system protein family protein [Candidatus Binatia bacterium]